MRGFLFKLLGHILGVWKKLPNKTKDKIISIIVDSFEYAFRQVYRKYENSNKDKKKDDTNE